MGELRVGVTEEHELIRAGVVFDGVTAVGVTFLRTQLLRFYDESADEAGLVLMRGKELRRQEDLLIRLLDLLLAQGDLRFVAGVRATPFIELRHL